MSVERSTLSVESSAPHGAVFLSYAREDTDAARRIADALRSHGIEAWFDQAELRGGDAWDAKLRTQIRTCTLFLPVISATTQARQEGYFRREWKLAVERTNDMAAGVAFLVPVVIDDTAEAQALVPDEFMRVQWTRLSGALPTPQFVEQVKGLLGSRRKPALKAELPRPPTLPPDFKLAARTSAMEAGRPRPAERGEGTAPPGQPVVPGWMWGVAAVIALGVTAFFALRKPEPLAAPVKASSAPASGLLATHSSLPATSSDKSIAVLPFANLSAEKENEFFADGVHEDVITHLAKIRDLKVISRTSVLAYRDPASRNLKKIAEELGVATVLEGSVRRVGNKVRVTAQLIDARTDAHLWADTYDGDLTDIFALQAKLAQQIAGALKATLTPGEREQIARRPTQNQEAYDLFLRARTLAASRGNISLREINDRAIAWLEQAVALDPNFADAYVQLASVHGIMYWFGTLDPTPERLAKMKAAVDAAVRLAPDLPETKIALGAYYYRGLLQFDRALAEFRAAQAGRPNDAELLSWIALTERRLGRWQEALANFEKSAGLNPRDLGVAESLLQVLGLLRRFPAAREAAARFLASFPDSLALLNAESTATFESDGDVAAFERRLRGMPPAAGDPDGLNRALGLALRARDYAAAERVLADPRLTSTPGRAAVINEPVAFARAWVAFLRDDRAAARTHADAALAALRAAPWSPRQEPWVLMATAQAHALAGRPEEALRDARAAWTQIVARDQFDARHFLEMYGEIYLCLGRNDDALASLRELFAGASVLGPREIRLDPLWSRLKDDPRFEEILRSAKPL